jgi:hypothetical protein
VTVPPKQGAASPFLFRRKRSPSSCHSEGDAFFISVILKQARSASLKNLETRDVTILLIDCHHDRTVASNGRNTSRQHSIARGGDRSGVRGAPRFEILPPRFACVRMTGKARCALTSE